MLVGFYDESGNDGHSTVFAMAGLLMSYSTSYYLGNDWSKILKHFGVLDYHASDFYGRRRQFSGWSDGRCSELEEAVVQLLSDGQIKNTGVAISKADYQESFVGTGFHKRLVPATGKWKKPYLQAFWHVVADLREYASHQQRGLYITPIFDRCQEFMGQAQQDYAQWNKDGKLGHISLSSAKDHAQIQAADFLVWQYRVEQERLLRTGDGEPGRVMRSLIPNMFLFKRWSFDYLECVRKRVEASMEGGDPDDVEFPTASVSFRGGS